MSLSIFSQRFIRSICLGATPLKKSGYILSALLLIACQPNSPNEAMSSKDNEAAEIPLISADSVTITRDHILSIKPTRYQPSLGLQGRIEPIKQINLVAAQPLKIEQVLVSENQWVKEGTPLLTVRHQIPSNKARNSNNVDSSETEAQKDTSSKITDLNKDKANHSDNGTLKSELNTKADITAPKDTATPTDASTINNDNSDSLTDNAKDTADLNSKPSLDKTSSSPNDLITLRASFSGRVENLIAQVGQQVNAQTPLLKLSDEKQLHFISTLPIEAESQISIGQTVNFTAEDRVDTFTGQVSKVQAVKRPMQLLVSVNVVNNEVSRNQIAPGMKVTGRVDYGQIEVGTIVPKNALHNVDLTQIQAPPYKPLRALNANIWIIGQDQRLVHQPIEVIEYDPLTKQYLIAGITNDSLICLANLPIESKGKKVVVS